MKKIILIILLSAIIITIPIIVLVNKNSNDEDSLKQDDTKEEQISQNEIEEDEVNENKIDYWVKEYEFPKKTKEFSLNLYDGFVQTPIKLLDFEDKCDYFSYHGSTIEDMGGHEVKKISEINTVLSSGETVDVYLHSNEGFAKLANFTIKNFSNQDKTTQECLENGWWNIEDFGHYNSTAAKYLGIEIPNGNLELSNKIYDNDEGIYLLEEVVNKLGRPTKILYSKGMLDRSDDIGVGMYSIVYEYSDFVFFISVTEAIYFDSNQYGRCLVNGIWYYTPEYWEEYKDEVWMEVDLLNE